MRAFKGHGSEPVLTDGTGAEDVFTMVTGKRRAPDAADARTIRRRVAMTAVTYQRRRGIVGAKK